MKKKINLYWYKHKEGHGNFGDELNPYIIGKITKSKINYIDLSLLYDNKILALKVLTKAFLDRRLNLSNLIRYCIFNFISKPKVFLAIGSVLQFCHIDNVQVWGSGMLSRQSKLPNGKYLAVRGYKTIERLKELNLEVPKVVGDPALLLPLLYKSDEIKRFKISVIPHYIHFDEYKRKIGDKFHIINLTDKIENVIDQIVQSEITISTSLHGIIVSHAYGVNSLRAEDILKKLSGDDVKFEDYYSSVKISNYQPLDSKVLFDRSETELIEIINDEYSSALLPDLNIIKEIQDNLLDVFPYKPKQ